MDPETAAVIANTVAQLDRIEAKVDCLITGPVDPIVTVREAMKLVGAKSDSAFYRELIRLGVRPVTYGRYRRLDITNAQARRLLKDQIRKVPTCP